MPGCRLVAREGLVPQSGRGGRVWGLHLPPDPTRAKRSLCAWPACGRAGTSADARSGPWSVADAPRGSGGGATGAGPGQPRKCAFNNRTTQFATSNPKGLRPGNARARAGRSPDLHRAGAPGPQNPRPWGERVASGWHDGGPSAHHARPTRQEETDANAGSPALSECVPKACPFHSGRTGGEGRQRCPGTSSDTMYIPPWAPCHVHHGQNLARRFGHPQTRWSSQFSAVPSAQARIRRGPSAPRRPARCLEETRRHTGTPNATPIGVPFLGTPLPLREDG